MGLLDCGKHRLRRRSHLRLHRRQHIRVILRRQRRLLIGLIARRLDCRLLLRIIQPRHDAIIRRQRVRHQHRHRLDRAISQGAILRRQRQRVRTLGDHPVLLLQVIVRRFQEGLHLFRGAEWLCRIRRIEKGMGLLDCAKALCDGRHRSIIDRVLLWLALS